MAFGFRVVQEESNRFYFDNEIKFQDSEVFYVSTLCIEINCHHLQMSTANVQGERVEDSLLPGCKQISL